MILAVDYVWKYQSCGVYSDYMHSWIYICVLLNCTTDHVLAYKTLHFINRRLKKLVHVSQTFYQRKQMCLFYISVVYFSCLSSLIHLQFRVKDRIACIKQ